MSEVASAIGDQAILEAFNSFDSWQALKARCHGKLRLVKQSEQRPAKPKPASPEEDALQMNDPWAEALLHRQLTPDTAFFQTADGTPPALLQKVSHGCTGVAIVDTKEAQILAKAEDDLSPDALSVIALGEADLPEARRPHRVIELPCRDHKDAKMLIKGTLVDLGAVRLKVAGEDALHPMQVVQSTCLAFEAHRPDFEEWSEFIQGPVRSLKRILGLTVEDVLH